MKHNLGTEKIGKLLLDLSLPATVAMMVNALYNLVDTIFVGRGVGPDAIGALAITWPISIIVMAFAIMIGTGGGSALSRYLGSGEKEKALSILGNSITYIFTFSIIFAAFSQSLLEPMLKSFGASENLLPYAMDYSRIILIGTVYFGFTMAANNLIRAEGNAKAAMIAMLLGTGLNIILDPIFIFGFNMGIKGAAYATIISQFASFIFVSRYIFSKSAYMKISRKHLIPKWDNIKEITLVGSSAFLRNILGSLIAVIMNHSLGYYGGDTAITTYGIINRVAMFLFMPMFGVLQGLQPIAGFNYGAKLYSRVKEAISISTKIVFFMALFGTAIVFIFPGAVIGLFTSDKTLIDFASPRMMVLMCALPIVSFQIVASTVFQSLGKAIPALIITLLRQVILLIPFVLILPKLGLGLWGIFIAFPLSDFLSTAYAMILLRKENAIINKLAAEEKAV